MNTDQLPKRQLRGVDHIAYVTWRPKETWQFYTQIMRMPLVHAVTAKGWIVDDFPDFCHFFLDMGNNNYIAFFYFFGLPPEEAPTDLMHRSRHIAFHVDTEEELTEWSAWLRSNGVRVTRPTTHELIESIYFDDPNGLQLEITRPLRPFEEIDSRDATRTLEAISKVAGQELPTIEDMWRLKFQNIQTEEKNND